MNTKRFFVLMMMGALIACHSAFAQGPAEMGPGHGRGFGPGPEKMMEETEEKAGITPEQKEKIKALREEFRKTQEALRDQMKAKHEALRQEFDAEKPDRQKAEALSEELISIEAQMARARLDHIFSIREILTPEQFQKVRAMIEEKRKNKRDRRRGPGSDPTEEGPGEK